MRHIPILLLLFVFSACSTTDDSEPIEEIVEEITPPIEEDPYFPPTSSNVWETISTQELEWDTNALNDLYDFLSTNNTRAFIILKDGRIVVEQYWGTTINTNDAFDQSSVWYWASAGKSLTAFLVGLAQQEGLLDINDKTSDYLGTNWTSLTPEQEDRITIKHQLSMATGLDYTVADLDCTTPDCLLYRTDAGQQWYYHNAPYTLLGQVVSNAASTSYNNFTDTRIESQIGMSGTWLTNGEYNNVYWSTARDAARFGLLMLNEGTWENTTLMTDTDYFSSMLVSSQDFNPSYGYLWWLNGKDQIIPPSFPNPFPTSLAPNAPTDLYAAMGKNGQFINVVPSQDLVVVRMGEAPDESLVPITFHNELWSLLQEVIAND